MYVCICYRINEQLIREAIKSGATTTEDVIKITGAAGNCGLCIDIIDRMIADKNTTITEILNRNKIR